MQFLYASGVIVLLIAALFLAMEWDYAKELFGLGLLIELLVFLITVVDPGPSGPTKAEPSRIHEINFPPKRTNPKLDPDSSKAHQLQSNLDELEEHMQRILNKNRELQHSIEVLEKDRRDYEQHRTDHEIELEDIRRNIQRTQEQLKGLLDR